MNRLIIFDCDGVLIDSERISVAVDARVLAHLGWPLSEKEVVERFVGRSSAVFEAALEERLGHRLAPDWEAAYQPWYERALERDLQPVEGIEAALDEIEARGHATCIASSSSHERLRFTLGLTGLAERFEGRVISDDDVGRGKPAPDLFELAARRFGIAAGSCVVVEDSPPGVEAAKAAGMRVLAFDTGLIPRGRLESTRPEAIFHRMPDLPDLVGEAR